MNKRVTKVVHGTEEDELSLINSAHSNTKRKFKLPKIELEKFSGDMKDWLRFWSQFRKIDEDEDIAPEDKFAYLLQSTVEGSRARDLINGFPPSADNYVKVIDCLKKRFGREDMLVEVYVRELLTLILDNVQHKQKIALVKLFDRLESHMRALDTLGVSSDKCAAMLYPLVESCLPEELLRAWQRSLPATVEGDDAARGRLDQLMLFLQLEVEREEKIALAISGFALEHKSQPRNSKAKTSVPDVPTAVGLLVSSSKVPENKVMCVFGEANGQNNTHLSTECFKARNMSLADKEKLLEARRLCVVCLKRGHTGKRCKLFVKCFVCGKKHASIMCPDINGKKQPQTQVTTYESRPTTSGTATSSQHTLANCSSKTDVLLQTLRVIVQGKTTSRAVRIIIDTGSQRSYILKELAAEMQYDSSGEETIVHQLFGGTETKEKKHYIYNVNLKNMYEGYDCCINMLEQPFICGAVPKAKSGPWLSELTTRKIRLSDIGNLTSEVEILLGADIAGKLFTGRRIELPTGVVAMETLLGWTLMGRIPTTQVQSSVALMVTIQSINSCDVSDLWKLDLIGIEETEAAKSRVDLMEAATIHFQNTISINSGGRYEIHLPWIENHPTLPSNFEIARKWLDSNTAKLRREGNLQRYDEVFREWLDDKIIEEVPETEMEVPCHYLPHRAVVKESSLTTKIRPVFDASARSKNSPSLNDCLEKGPNLIELIPNLLLQFRWRRIGLVADIRRAFLQISVQKKDCDLLRFLWWDQNFDKVKVFRHLRVVFGVSSSPFLLGAVINHHLQRAPSELKPQASKLMRSFYVDNCVASVDSKHELKQFIENSQVIMKSGEFDLRGWEFTGESATRVTSVLGMLWDKEEDTLYCNIENIKSMDLNIITKRIILSMSHRIFDPIGFLCPVTLCSKLMLQQTWETKLSWDAEVSTTVRDQFLRWAKDLYLLEHVRIPRLMFNDSAVEKYTLHTFCDASQSAYAAVVYIRYEIGNQTKVQLVSARSRVAPVKKMTIPRLELLAALIGARLTQCVMQALCIENKVANHYWSDSTTVLGWLNKEEIWATFVGNRVKEIKELSIVSQWKYVPSEYNPADLPSRGCNASILLKTKWWEGPQWLCQPSQQWPTADVMYDESAINSEKRKTIVSMLNSEQYTLSYSRKFSKYNSIVRVVGWQLRFCFNCRTPTDKRTGMLIVSEIKQAEIKLLFLVQKESLEGPSRKILKSLCTHRDDGDGLYRIKTKITRRDDSLNFRFPIILPSKHPIVDLLIKSKHEQLCHSGLQVTLNNLREDFWILGGRKAIRSVLRKCVRCRRQESKRLESPPAPLPLNRVREATIFEIVGVDLAGPVILKGGNKAWIVLFTCAVFRVIHLEVVTSLSSEIFLQSFRRFIARRGRPVTVYSDNGTNFVGSDNAMKMIDWNIVKNYSAAERINWIFNPPSAAWWGGFWERLIGMLKRLLRKTLGKTSLQYEEFTTVLCDCESIINSRPLTYVYDGTSDLIPLTPDMFLHERKEIGVPDLDNIDGTSLNRRLKYRQRLREDLRNRFRLEYLGQLVQKFKLKEYRKLNVGDVVLIEVDNVKRISWPLARIEELIAGKDGEVRVVKLRTATGTFTRPIQRIYPLELLKESETELIEKMTKAKVPKKISHKLPYTTRSGRLVKIPDRFMS